MCHCDDTSGRCRLIDLPIRPHVARRTNADARPRHFLGYRHSIFTSADLAYNEPNCYKLASTAIVGRAVDQSFRKTHMAPYNRHNLPYLRWTIYILAVDATVVLLIQLGISE